MRFDSIIQGLGNNLYDAAISAMTITPEREGQIDFSEPYFNADQSLLVQSDSDIESTDDLGDAAVGVQIGTTGAMEAQKYQEQGKVSDVRTFNTVTDAFNALENGQVDAVINDFPVSVDGRPRATGSSRSSEHTHSRRAVRDSLPDRQRAASPRQQGATGDQEGRHLREALREVVRREAAGDPVGKQG